MKKLLRVAAEVVTTVTLSTILVGSLCGLYLLSKKQNVKLSIEW